MNTKQIIIGVIGIIIALIILAIGWTFFSGAKQSSHVTGGQSPVTFPGSGNAKLPVTTTTTAPPANKLSIPVNGGSVITNDFIHNGTTIPDTANKGRYLLAGDLGYCVTDPAQCKAGSTTDFNIFYDSTSQSFTIALLVEPLGRTRLEVEQFLMRTLGITQSQMCKLNYYVGTTSDVNPLYDSKNLGFSFCQGATELPQ